MSDVFVCCVFRRNINKHADENGYGNEQQREQVDSVVQQSRTGKSYG